MKTIILAGGKGTRLWPLSRGMTPKQMIDFGEGQSMLQKTLSRLTKVIASENIVISTNEKLLEKIELQINGFSDTQLIVEPCNRSTAAAVCLSLKYLLEQKKLTKKDVCLVCPSDLHFSHEEHFLSLLPKAKSAAQNGVIVTFGIAPSFPETGYGYIQAEALHGEAVLSVTKFVEKPDHKTAQRFLDEGNYFWNSGMFVFEIGHFLSEIKQVNPLFTDWMKQSYQECYETFDSLPSISFDKAFMEKTKQIALIPYHSGWSDLGSWERLYHFFPKDDAENASKGDVDFIRTEKTLVFGGKRKVITVGVEDLIVVDTKDFLLISKMGEDIKGLAEKYNSYISEGTEHETEVMSLASDQELR